MSILVSPMHRRFNPGAGLGIVINVFYSYCIFWTISGLSKSNHMNRKCNENNDYATTPLNF